MTKTISPALRKERLADADLVIDAVIDEMTESYVKMVEDRSDGDVTLSSDERALLRSEVRQMYLAAAN